MWKKEKNNTKNPVVQGGSSTTSTIRTSAGTAEYSSRIERTYSSTTHHVTTTSSSATKSERIVSSNHKNTFSRSPSLSDNTNWNKVLPSTLTASTKSLTNVSKPRTIFQTDARPFTPPVPSENPSGYKSPFTRQLRPYNQEKITESPPLRTTRTLSLPSPPNSWTNNGVPTYNTSGKKRGKVLVINNVKFMDNNSDRDGAVNDELSVSDLFKSMGFDVQKHRDLKQKAMIDKIKKFRSDKDLQKVDISVVIIMSHGNNVKDQTAIPGGYTEISGVDGKGLSVDEVLNEFDTKNCSGMEGKPKIFIFQCCRGNNSEILQTDAKPMKGVKQHADMLVAFSTLPGFYSLRDPQKGSWYIQSICSIFKEHAKNHDIETMLKMVDEDLTTKHPGYTQTSSYESRGFKRCYLNPTR